ncbi:hypothetical protein [Natronorarus salvus]|uniref:hypothetical protein n=1 Tax=Natronorarus salvus TaxID=3117733 RepID=UPI002F261107
MFDREQVLFVTVAIAVSITTVFPSLLFVRLVTGASLAAALWIAVPGSLVFVAVVVVLMLRTEGTLIPPLD